MSRLTVAPAVSLFFLFSFSVLSVFVCKGIYGINRFLHAIIAFCEYQQSEEGKKRNNGILKEEIAQDSPSLLVCLSLHLGLSSVSHLVLGGSGAV